LLTANIAGNEAKLMELDSLIKLFDRGSLLLTPIVNQKNQLIKQLSLDNEKENQLSAIYNSDFKVVHLVEKAEVPLRKYRPKRSLYVIAAFLLSLFFSILVVLIMEESKAIKFD
jgi:LPS O-antigen subunit length determinant protein (WzzB/FepE family)